MNKPIYVCYHDEEWGVPIHDERKMFEFIVLESFQAGLSWEIILNKRESFKKAFDGFNVEKIAAYGKRENDQLIQDAGIVRNRLKIEATVNNAKKFIKTAGEFGSFCDYLWKFTEGKPMVNHWKSLAQIPATTPLSDSISEDMKQRGFKFFGSTVCYAHMQAVGMVNDHTVDCFRHKECEAML
ncbi:MAG: DNA-3-methyladenine glycosylase I [Candidatus Neomarinimicrobiota bacterium]|nr:DNA-3-methyladenine glycosylase I [Candidatus Neomarinimicrobiota bacterium]